MHLAAASAAGASWSKGVSAKARTLATDLVDWCTSTKRAPLPDGDVWFQSSGERIDTIDPDKGDNIYQMKAPGSSSEKTYPTTGVFSIRATNTEVNVNVTLSAYTRLCGVTWNEKTSTWEYDTSRAYNGGSSGKTISISPQDCFRVQYYGDSAKATCKLTVTSLLRQNIPQ